MENYNDSDMADCSVSKTISLKKPDNKLQQLEQKAAAAQENFEKEEKLRKELEALNSKLFAEKQALLDSLSGEKGALQDYQEKAAKLTAQKNDLENQLRVSIPKKKKMKHFPCTMLFLAVFQGNDAIMCIKCYIF